MRGDRRMENPFVTASQKESQTEFVIQGMSTARHIISQSDFNPND
ncbi:hypothetical protein ACFOQM_09500 [Paenibacillus sp. GCM10012307]